MSTLITMFTDASFCAKTQIGAYAVWAKTNGKTIRHSGVLKQKIADSGTAEIMAIVNGLHIAIAAIQPALGARIIAQSDCLTAINILNSSDLRARVQKKYAKMREAYHQIVMTHSLRIDFRHVSAHRGTETARNAVNTWCDEECRRLMREARNKTEVGNV